MGKEWVKLAFQIQEYHPELNFDLPNTHLLIEFLIRSLPILKNANFSRTGAFESHHRLMKETMRNYQTQGAIMFEKCTLSQLCLQDALRFVFEGGRWGNNLEFRAGDGLLKLQNYIKGKEHLPHPLLRHLCPQRIEEKLDCNYKSSWRIKGYVYVTKGNYKVIDTSPPTPEEKKQIQAALDQYYADDKVQLNDESSFTWTTGFVDTSSFRRLSVWCGEDIEILFGGTNEFIRIQKCLIVTHLNHVYPLLFPLWYQKKERTTVQLLTKWEGNQDDLIPLPPHLFTQHVLVFHNCNRKCVCGQKICICEVVCSIKMVCKTHLQYNCGVCSKSTFVKADIHSHNNEYMMFDSSSGFELDS